LSEQGEKRHEKNRQAASPGYLEVIGIVLIIVLAAFFVYDRFLVPRVKVVDLKGYLQTQKALLTAGAITEEQWKRKLDSLEQVLRKYHLVILKDVAPHHDPDDEIHLQ